jgi:hypothetical protein
MDERPENDKISSVINILGSPATARAQFMIDYQALSIHSENMN